jgi:outer membrane protein OmpA-like peptidoglycan-associated protein
MSNGDRPVPKINDSFWFDYSEKLVNSAQENRGKAAEKTKEFVKWLWPIYTAGTAIGFGLSGKALPIWANVLIAVAGAALIFVYWSTLYIELPRVVEFDPRSPTEIKAAYKVVILSKQKWLRISMIASLVAAFLVSLALMFASTLKAEKPLLHDMKASITMVNNTLKLAVTASVGKAEQVFLTVRPIKSDPCIAGIGPLLLTPEDAMVFASISLDKMAPPLEVSLEWKNAAGTKMMLSKEIKADGGTKQQVSQESTQPKPPHNGKDLAKEIKTRGFTTIQVNFDVDKSVIRPESEAAVKQVAQMLKDNPELDLIIAGHTDSSGTWAHNKTLSESRAQAVVQAVLARGVAASRLVSTGYGQDKPIADNATVVGRARNRRVELMKR